MSSSTITTQKDQDLVAWLRHWIFKTGIEPVTYTIRFTSILVITVFFIVPLIWLFTATTKTNLQLVHLPPLSTGAINYIKKAWDYISMFYYGVTTRWIFISFYYVVCGLMLSLFTAVPVGFALAVIKFRGRKWLLWLTLLVMLVP
jgi:multiple sugar transport system permease protein